MPVSSLEWNMCAISCSFPVLMIIFSLKTYDCSVRENNLITGIGDHDSRSAQFMHTITYKYRRLKHGFVFNSSMLYVNAIKKKGASSNIFKSTLFIFKSFQFLFLLFFWFVIFLFPTLLRTLLFFLFISVIISLI